MNRQDLLDTFEGRECAERMSWFAYSHLSEARLKKTSAQFAELAVRLATECPDGETLNHALDKLVEAKDAAVRARVASLGLA